MTNSEQKKMQKALERIAAEHLGIETLTARKRDCLDFHEVGVWGVSAFAIARVMRPRVRCALTDLIRLLLSSLATPEGNWG